MSKTIKESVREQKPTVLYVARLTNGNWTRYFEDLGELSSHLYTSYYATGSKVFEGGKHTWNYGMSGGLDPVRTEVRAW